MNLQITPFKVLTNSKYIVPLYELIFEESVKNHSNGGELRCELSLNEIAKRLGGSRCAIDKQLANLLKLGAIKNAGEVPSYRGPYRAYAGGTYVVYGPASIDQQMLSSEAALATA